MMPLLFVLLVSGCAAENATGDYDPTEILGRIFNSYNRTQPRAGYGLVHFENQHEGNPDNQGYSGYETKPVKFEDNLDHGGVGMFQENRIKKKRRRKQKQQAAFVQQYDGVNPNFSENFYMRPTRRPPSVASSALASVTEALASIARYDDQHCVPRLLCESASGGALGGTQILQSVAGLEPLMTLLSAYSGVSSNPLFVFGRAVLLGMSSKGNAASCRYAYPLCPTDPEKLVHYLNNHNGGFFRFFNSPQEQQNLGQFYNQLSQNAQPQYNQNGEQNYGFYKPSLYGTSQQEHYALYKPSLYGTTQHGQYGLAYNNYNHIGIKTNKIEKRIQNRPSLNSVEGDSKWKFPDKNNESDFEYEVLASDNDYIVNNDFKFPEVYRDNYRKTRGFAFPDNSNAYTKNIQESDNFVFSNHNDNDKYVKNNKFNYNYINNYNNDNKYVQDDKFNHYYANNYNNGYFENDGETVYVVRGNGDPNKPEIIKLKPGQSIGEALKS